jgi:hypothetical protein
MGNSESSSRKESKKDDGGNQSKPYPHFGKLCGVCEIGVMLNDGCDRCHNSNINHYYK